MTTPNEPNNGPLPDDSSKAFTQDDVNRIVEERLKRERSRYSDYDDLKAKASKYDELEDKNKSENERITSDRDSHKSRADKAESELMRLTVGLHKGLTAAQAKRLVGATKEELDTDADELLETFGATKKKDDGPDDGSKNESGSSDEDGSKDDTSTRRPREKLRDGAAPNEETQNGSPDDLADAVLKKSRGY